MRLRSLAVAAAGLIAVLIGGTGPRASAQGQTVSALASRIDPYVDKQRVVVMTDIANEPDDQMSMVRFLVYSNQLEVEGLVATTSTWMKSRVRPDVLQMIVSAYGEVRPTLSQHEAGFPTAEALRAVIVPGQPGYGMAAVGPDKMTPGATLILTAAERNDPRPLWVLSWGGANTLAQALIHARATRSAAQLDALVARTPRLRDLRSGRCGAVASPGVPVVTLRRNPVNPGRRSVLPGDVDRHQRRPLL